MDATRSAAGAHHPRDPRRERRRAAGGPTGAAGAGSDTPDRERQGKAAPAGRRDGPRWPHSAGTRREAPNTGQALRRAHRSRFGPPSPIQRTGDRAPRSAWPQGAARAERAVFSAAQSVAQSADLAVRICPEIGASVSFYRNKWRQREGCATSSTISVDSGRPLRANSRHCPTAWRRSNRPGSVI